MTDTSLKPLETEVKSDATADLAHVKATIASDELKVKTEALSVWTHWAPYVCLAVGIVVGIALNHFFATR